MLVVIKRNNQTEVVSVERITSRTTAAGRTLVDGFTADGTHIGEIDLSRAGVSLLPEPVHP